MGDYNTDFMNHIERVSLKSVIEASSLENACQIGSNGAASL